MSMCQTIQTRSENLQSCLKIWHVPKNSKSCKTKSSVCIKVEVVPGKFDEETQVALTNCVSVQEFQERYLYVGYTKYLRYTEYLFEWPLTAASNPSEIKFQLCLFTKSERGRVLCYPQGDTEKCLSFYQKNPNSQVSYHPSNLSCAPLQADDRSVKNYCKISKRLDRVINAANHNTLIVFLV